MKWVVNMTNTVKSFLSAVGVVVIAAMIMGMKTLYDDHNLNNQHRENSKQVVQGLHTKIDKILDNQSQFMNEQSRMKANQDFLIKRYEAEVNK